MTKGKHTPDTYNSGYANGYADGRAECTDLLAALRECRDIAKTNDTHSHRMRIAMIADKAIAKAEEAGNG